MITMKTNRIALTVTLAAALAACQQGTNDPEPPPSTSPEPAPETSDSVSILRPNVEAELDVESLPTLGTLERTVRFAKGGATLDDDAIAVLEEVLASDQLALELPITLRAHSDSAGSDAANARAAEQRGLAVADWLIERGVASQRINVVVFGEQNPIEPNALPDGSPNEKGRAANRRVEIEIAFPSNGNSAPEQSDPVDET